MIMISTPKVLDTMLRIWSLANLVTSYNFVVEVLPYVHRNRRHIREGSPRRPALFSHRS